MKQLPSQLRHVTSQHKTIDATETRKNDFIEGIIERYDLKNKEGVEIRTKAVCNSCLSDAHPTDDLITEILFKDRLIAMVYQRRDGFNWTETNCVDMNPLPDCAWKTAVRKKESKRDRYRNPRTQFELHTFDYDNSVISEAYDWCLKNLQLKDERGIMYRVNELYIITSSQRIVDKVNARFGSNFSFAGGATPGLAEDNRVYFIQKRKLQ